MDNIIYLSEHLTGARYFRPRVTAAGRTEHETTPRKESALRLQAPSRIRRGDKVRDADGSEGFVLRETPAGKVIVTVNGISRTVDPQQLEKAGSK